MTVTWERSKYVQGNSSITCNRTPHYLLDITMQIGNYGACVTSHQVCPSRHVKCELMTGQCWFPSHVTDMRGIVLFDIYFMKDIGNKVLTMNSLQ